MPKPKPFPSKTKYSIFAYGVNSYEHISEDSKYTLGFIPVSIYCQRRFITRNILRKFVKKGWVLIEKGSRSRIGVKELCSEDINEYLGID